SLPKSVAALLASLLPGAAALGGASGPVVGAVGAGFPVVPPADGVGRISAPVVLSAGGTAVPSPGGVPPFAPCPGGLSSPPVVPSINDVAALRTESGALACFGSTSVGSPTFTASVVSGECRKFSIIFPYIPSWPRLSISFLFCAIASGVGVGTGRFIVWSFFL